MGRKKIQITRIQDERNRQITFSKRKAGLLKKAYELSILCDVDIAVIMITHNSKLYQYASSNMNSILIRYTEFKDPDESKTNADILEEINKKERNGRGEDSGEELEDPSSTGNLPITPNTQARFHRIEEEFDHVLHQPEIPSSALPQQIASPLILPVTKVPQAMPVTVPVAGYQRLGSTGSSHAADSPITPSSVKTMGRSPLSVGSSGGSMPPPAGTPTRLQAIRSQTLKLHLPGGGRNYIPLGSPGSGSTMKSPQQQHHIEEVEIDKEGELDSTSNRPQLRVVIPGQKGFMSRNTPSSPPPEIIEENDDQSLDNRQGGGREGKSVTTTMTVAPPPPPIAINNGSLTTPIMSLTTPSLISSIPPGLSNFTADIPGLSDIGSGSAIVAFPVNIQPSSSTSSSTGGGGHHGNIIIQAQNTGQPFLLTPSHYDKQGVGSMNNNNPTALGPSHLLTPPTTLSSGTSNLRDLEQLKLQYDRIYQQISQTLQQHHNNSQATPPSLNVGPKSEEEELTPPPVKRLHVETNS